MIHKKLSPFIVKVSVLGYFPLQIFIKLFQEFANVIKISHIMHINLYIPVC